MPSRGRRRLTPKVAALVATDRLRRPEPGRLTPAQAAQLLEVARGEREFDEPVSVPRAIVALSAGRPEAAMPLLEEVVADAGRPPADRRAAAEGLGQVASPDAERLLLRIVRDSDPRVQQAAFKALGPPTRSASSGSPRRWWYIATACLAGRSWLSHRLGEPGSRRGRARPTSP